MRERDGRVKPLSTPRRADSAALFRRPRWPSARAEQRVARLHDVPVEPAPRRLGQRRHERVVRARHELVDQVAPAPPLDQHPPASAPTRRRIVASVESVDTCRSHASSSWRALDVPLARAAAPEAARAARRSTRTRRAEGSLEIVNVSRARGRRARRGGARSARDCRWPTPDTVRPDSRVRQLVERAPAIPLKSPVQPGAGNRPFQPRRIGTSAATCDRCAPSRSAYTNSAAGIFHPRRRVAELGPRPRDRAQAPRAPGRARLGAAPPQRKREMLLAIDGDDDAVRRVFAFETGC